jgi:hypothetical protein
MGQSRRLLRGAAGEAFRSWADEVPNGGLIRHLDLFNQEHVLVVEPAALADAFGAQERLLRDRPSFAKAYRVFLAQGFFLLKVRFTKYALSYVSFNLRH